MKHGRDGTTYRPVDDRLGDYRCVQEDFPAEKSQDQASRCMDCGIPFCNNGCPLGNIIPDFNDLVFRDKWEDALARLHSTNNFPEFTGMVCPAPCEQACVLGINQDPVTIKQIEWEIVRRGWDEGWVRALLPERRSGRSVAVVGSGPSGLAASQQLTRAGHTVTLFEKNDRIGGLLRYGIPDFKMGEVAHRPPTRPDARGGRGVPDAASTWAWMCRSPICARTSTPSCSRWGPRPRETWMCRGESSMVCTTRWNSCPSRTAGSRGDTVPEQNAILATDKHVVILGGGDTGSDCIGTSHRQGARSVTSLELLPRPPEGRHESEPWPQSKKYYFNVSSSHAEGGAREYARMTTELVGVNGRVTTLRGVEVSFERDVLNRPLMPSMQTVPGQRVRDAGGSCSARDGIPRSRTGRARQRSRC